MRSRYRVHHPERAHFVTCTIVEWLPVFTSQACCDILVRSLEHCRRNKGLKIYAWVILDTHFHAILAASDLASVLRDLKSFTTRQVLRQLELGGPPMAPQSAPLLSSAAQAERLSALARGIASAGDYDRCRDGAEVGVSAQ
jgi:REP element-mobilizing transposase RayT